jgi:hypothetical protein
LGEARRGPRAVDHMLSQKVQRYKTLVSAK